MPKFVIFQQINKSGVSINVADILYCKPSDHGTYIFMSDGETLEVVGNLEEVTNRLND